MLERVPGVAAGGARRLVALGAALVLALGTGCSQKVTVEVSPAMVSVVAGDTQAFSATVTGTSDTAVTWSVVESGGGTVTDSGLYTAPQTPGAYTVRATSRTDATVTADAKVTVTARPAVSLTVSPDTRALLFGEQVSFTATVQNAQDTSVTWSVEGGDANGTVTAAGVYTAPEKEGTFRVVARANADTSKTASATVTVSKPPVKLRFTPATARVKQGAQAVLGLEVLYGDGTEVAEVRVLEQDGGSLYYDAESKAVMYASPSTLGTYTLVATLAGHPEVEARATVTTVEEEPAAVLHGTVRYGGSKTGRIYVSYGIRDWSGGLASETASVSLEAPGTFTLRPLYNPMGARLMARAFLDVLGTGTFNAAVDPSVTVPLWFGGDDVTLDLTLQEPAPTSAPQLQGRPSAAAAGSDSLVVSFGSALGPDGTGAEAADAYVVYWSDRPEPGPANTLGTLTVPASTSAFYPVGGQTYLAAIPNLAPGTYYVAVAPRSGTLLGTAQEAWDPVVVQAAGAASVSGTVNLEGVPQGGWLYAVTMTMDGSMHAARFQATGSSVTWSLPDLPDDAYSVLLAYDQDGDGQFGLTEPAVREGLTVYVQGTTVAPAVTLDALPARAALKATVDGTFFSSDVPPGLASRLVLEIQGGSKQVVQAQLTGGQGLLVPYDLPHTSRGGVLGLDLSGLDLSTLPAGTTFTVHATYADGTTADFPLEMRGVPPAPQTFSPVGSVDTTTPTFTWTLPAELPASATQTLSVVNEFSYALQWRHVMGPDVRSVTYGTGTPGTALRTGGWYRWSYVAEDAYGNRTVLTGSFDIPEPQPAP